jgi:ubiquitin-conjugating enzyme E2 Q
MCANDDAPLQVAAALKDCSFLEGLDLGPAVEAVAKCVRYKSTDQDGDTQMVDSGVEDYENTVSDIEDSFYTDEDLGFSTRRANNFRDSNQKSETPAVENDHLKPRICSDLAIVKEAGFKVGVHGNIFSAERCYVCVSILMVKLGLSEEAMQAWNVNPSQYLVLAISYQNGYKTIDQVFKDRKQIDFKVGLCASYKPTLRDIFHLFQQTRPGHPLHDSQKSQSEEFKTENSSTIWLTSFISAPLEDLLNERFIPILKNRDAGMPWQGAENFYHDTQGITVHSDELDYDKYLKEDGVRGAYPEIVGGDHVLDANHSTRSFPLIAMQFLLRHFVRCTEFCLVCHCSLNSDLEAIKPYVCNRPLCLYQYMSLGFGPEIEHEIKTQPYVVDLLISFCWQSAKDGKLSEFPTGLGFSIPEASLLSPIPGRYTPQIGQPSESPSSDDPYKQPTPEEAQFDPTICELIYPKSSKTVLRNGDWVQLKESKIESQDNSQHHRVLEVFGPVIKLSRLPLHVNMHIESHGTIGSTEPNSHISVNVYKYERNFDSLSNEYKRAVILNQIELLPSVNDMKKWLEAHPMSNLSKWNDRISPSALAILRWIIASNRSCILEADESERVRGMDDWMQFRFAMGAPVCIVYLRTYYHILIPSQDKEQRFVDAVNHLVEKDTELNHPTIFAWHGSPLANWHSIIREALHYNYVASGRAYGDGVYHSLDYNTSKSYSSSYRSGQGWSKSMIQINSTMCLSEIVNSPKEFVSKTPHLVINKLDWIQTRYLFVKGENTQVVSDDGQPNHRPTLNPLPSSMIFEQDPIWTATGSNQGEKIIIPLSAIPQSRRPKTVQPVNGHNISSETAPSRTSSPLSSSHRRTASVISGLFKRQKVEVDASKLSAENPQLDEIIDLYKDDDSASVITLDEDLEIFIEYDTKQSSPWFAMKIGSQLRHIFGGDKSSSASRPDILLGFKDESTEDKTPADRISSTNFEPGKLDYKRLPLLPPPTDAALGTTKQLLAQFRSLKKTQDTTTQHELGWYTDPNQLENPFQWIIELHSFPDHLPLTKQMRERKIPSVVLEIRFPTSFPYSPPFIRIIRPRFLPFMSGGGGHVTVGGSLCMELLTSDGWLATYDFASVLFQVRLAICSEDPRPAQLDRHSPRDYGIYEAVNAYVRACNAHGWRVPEGFQQEIRSMDETVSVPDVGDSGYV